MTAPTPTVATSSSRKGNPSSRMNLGWLWYFFFLFALLCIALFFIPAIVIRPFGYQAPRPLLLAMYLRQHAPQWTILPTILCVICAVLLWKNGRVWRRITIAATMLLVAFSAVMTRLNYFEWMFHPITSPQFVAQATSKLDAKEMILAVQEGNDARAYPISQMAYHHILNDEVNGAPIAVTY